jgi:cobalamin-dependent methionine synthase I
MIIIGEKINGTRNLVGKAIVERDTAFIQDLALRQVKAGISWLDVNAGGSSEQESEALVWLIETIQGVTEIPLCIDSVNPDSLAIAISHVKHSPMINSISGERKRLERILPLVNQYQCPVIMLAMDDKGIPKTTEDRMTIIDQIITETRRLNLNDELLYVDPLVIALAVDTESGKIALQTMRAIHAKFPKVHIVSGLSNISFGLPARTLINRVFMTLAIEAGLDTAILDPLDKGLISTVLASEMVLGQDRYCLKYNKAFRAGMLEYKTVP